MKAPGLPVLAAIPALRDALSKQGVAVLHAPPGAGKTTGVPLALLEHDAFQGRLLLLEPRRLAARNAAVRMAETLGEPVGQTIGYRMRGESKVSKATRIEVVTEGILTAMVQSDPDLPGVGMVAFDEFHERSLSADFGLALCWEVRGALREDLKLLVMSATLDTGPISDMLDGAPVVASPGQSHPVDVNWRDRPPDQTMRLEAQVAGLVREALAAHRAGSCLVFLPGAGEIHRVGGLLSSGLPGNVDVLPLYGAMAFKDQQAAIQPAPKGRRNVVLATSIAETSLTLPDVRIVVDAGLARRARHDPARAMSRLVTERVTKAEATQRAGRAGRVAPGVCYRNWTRGEDGGLAPFAPPEIAVGDLTALALDLAIWGDPMGEGLAFLDPPAPGPLARARELLEMLGALENELVTEHGRRLSQLPLHPRIGHMLLTGGAGSADLAALLEDRDPMRDAGVDAGVRLRALRRGGHPWVKRMAGEARRLKRHEAGVAGQTAAQMAARAFPDRIGMRREGEAPRWRLSGGTGAFMRPSDALAGARLIVAVDLDGDRREARVRLAFALSEAELRAVHGHHIGWDTVCFWDSRSRRVIAREQERFGALVLNERQWKDAPQEQVAAALLEGLRDLGLETLNWSTKARKLRARLAIGGVVDVSDSGLLNALEDWLLPFLGARSTGEDLRRLDPREALKAWAGWDTLAQLDRDVPAHYTTPLGRKIEIDYGGGLPEVALRLQEVFGETKHPVVGPDRVPLRMVLLSPAHKPIQVTQDLPGFWDGSYGDVRKDMRGQYPKHPWPEDPRAADPTMRAKPRR